MPPQIERPTRAGDAAVRAAPAQRAETLRPPAQAATVGIDGPQAAGLGAASSVDAPAANTHTVSTGFGELPLSGRPPLLPPPPRVDSAQARIAPPAPQRVVHPPAPTHDAPTRPDTRLPALPVAPSTHTPREHAATVPLPTPTLADRGQRIALAPQERHPAADTQPPPAHHSAQPTHEAPPTAVFTKSPEPVAADGQTHQETHPAAPEAGDLHLPSPVLPTAEPGTTASPKTLQEGLPVLVAHTPGDDPRPASAQPPSGQSASADVPQLATAGEGGIGNGNPPDNRLLPGPEPDPEERLAAIWEEIKTNLEQRASEPGYVKYKAIAEELTQKIESGDIPGRTPLPETETFAEMLGVEPSDIRRARTVLRKNHLVATRPGVATIVVDNTLDIESAYPVPASELRQRIIDQVLATPDAHIIPSPKELAEQTQVKLLVVYRTLQSLVTRGDIIKDEGYWFKPSDIEDPKELKLERLLQLPTARGEALRFVVERYNILDRALPPAKVIAHELGISPQEVEKAYRALSQLGFATRRHGRPPAGSQASGPTLTRSLPEAIASAQAPIGDRSTRSAWN